MQGVKIGCVVKVMHKGNERIGIVTWKKDNSNIGINFGHFHLYETGIAGIGFSDKKKLDHLKTLGADDVFEKQEIIEVIKIYK